MENIDGIPASAFISELNRLANLMDTALEKFAGEQNDVATEQQLSARNLIEYLAIRTEDIRPLQDQLHVLGLSSLQSSESHIRSQLQAIMQRLGAEITPDNVSPCTYHVAANTITRRSRELFGRKGSSIPYVMVTLDASFADDLSYIKKLLLAGMNVARINCAHDDAETWMRMIETVRKASKKTASSCTIYMDLAGPKLRTLLLGKTSGKKKGRLTMSLEPGQEIVFAERDAPYNPKDFVIGCEERGIISQLEPGDRILFDDGLFEMKVLSVDVDMALLKVVRISAKKPRLKAEKGINFPDTPLEIASLTAYDREQLPFVCQHADLIGYSFVRHPADLKLLQELLEDYDERPKIVLKIETAESVQNLPSLLLQAMEDDVYGVMVARGDLAAEVGFERLSEVQEEIVWISEAAHAPVVWATQVMDTMNKSGIATRAEVTDASFAAVSECVMINKGTHTLEVIKSLKDILERSGSHRLKKRHTCRAMSIAARFIGGE